MDILEIMRVPYRAVIKEEWKKVKEELKDKTKIVFPMTASGDTAVHLAVYSGEEEPLRALLGEISEMDEAFWRNSAGNTPLHEAATVGNLAAVKLLVEYDKDDLVGENIYGETPLFRAARCGHLHIVNYMLEDCEDLFSRSSRNWTTKKGNPLIHAAIQSQKFEVALKLIEFDKSLLEMTDPEGKTALHVLANMPFAFRSGYSMKFFESIIYTRLYLLHFLTGIFWRFIFLGWPQWKVLYEKKQQHRLALTITKMLAHVDFSWRQTQLTPPENTEVDSLGIHRPNEGNGVNLNILRTQPSSDQNQGEVEDIEYYDHHETPLLLAAANGIIEIVQQIVEVYPQAVDYLTVHQRNVLHVAIAYRQKTVFNWIQNHRLIMTRLVTRIDALGFTALHHVGITKFYRGGTHGPALQLQHELKWYERVQSEIPALYNMHHNSMKWTAREFFYKTHEKMLEDAKEWLKKTSESCSAVAVLVATVVFAAAYTVPGGLNSQTGSPVLLTEPIYIVFTIMDIVALATALTSVVLFLSILTSSFKMEDFLHALPLKLSIGFQLLFFSVASTMMAFALTIVLTVKSEEMKWTVSLLYIATFFPVTMFIIIQLPLYVELVKNIWSYRHNITKFLPMGFLALFWKLPSKTFSRKIV
ncbi:uncharacterized protein LOC120082801 isoform X2 [Benincasa hispida]|uniref:uncharacterized protein LOC120082801 isoform X2 n=1 Tax=Benincasa hispida TaxID=102211 RepID=UPI001900F33D|nr:uncharacterized protein LOC120082801 isoform X2 [Benincasa hispida]